MNGEQDPILPQLAVANPLVMLLEQLTAQAKAGGISSIAVIHIGPRGELTTLYGGAQRGDLYVGSALLQKRLLGDIEAPQQGPKLVRATAFG